VLFDEINRYVCGLLAAFTIIHGLLSGFNVCQTWNDYLAPPSEKGFAAALSARVVPMSNPCFSLASLARVLSASILDSW
jgi:hypothetical protein